MARKKAKTVKKAKAAAKKPARKVVKMARRASAGWPCPRTASTPATSSR